MKTPEELLKNFMSQQQEVTAELRKLETELAHKRELFLKLQGAIEALNILEEPESDQLESDTDA